MRQEAAVVSSTRHRRSRKRSLEQLTAANRYCHRATCEVCSVVPVFLVQRTTATLEGADELDHRGQQGVRNRLLGGTIKTAQFEV